MGNTKKTSVLLPTDLSERALEAAEMTIRSLGTTDVRYTLVHAYFELGTMDPLLPSVTAEMHEAAVQGLADHLHRLKERLAPLDTDIRTSASFGPLASTVDREARELHADLVVMYTGDPATRTVFGTNTARVIGEAHVPVLELPYEVRDLRIRRILLADDQAALEPRSLHMVAFLAQRSQAELIIAHVATGRPEWDRADHGAMFREVFQGIAMRSVMVEDDDVAEALLGIAARERADLIAAVHRHEGFLNDLFHRSTTRKLALASSIPVLALEQ